MITLITEPQDYSPKAISFYKKLGKVYFLPELSKSQEKKVLTETDILVVRLKHHLNKKWFDKMPNLKIIATNTTGLNHIDIEEARKKKIRVISLRGHRGFLREITSTAELNIGLAIALIRNIPWAHNDVVKKGRWDRDSFKGYQLRGKTYGVLGYGRLGRIVSRYAKAFNMKVIAYDPFISDTFLKRQGIKPVSMDRLFKESDVLSLQVLLTEETRGLIKERHLKLMKPTSYIINTARGEILKKGVLYKALKNKWIKGAAIDVMRDESSDGSHLRKSSLWQYAKKNKNLIIVPHIGGAAYEAMQTTEEYIADLVKKYIKTKKLI